MARRESSRDVFILVAFLFFGLILVNNMCKVREGHNVVNENGEVLYTQTISLEEVQRAAAESADMAQKSAADAALQASEIENAIPVVVSPPTPPGVVSPPIPPPPPPSVLPTVTNVQTGL